MFPVHKNSYLQTKTTIDPRIINRCVDQAREKPTIDQFDENPPFQRLTSAQPVIPVHNCDVTRRPLAFGRLAMPKLRRELHSKDPEVVMQAINSICDLVHDPERNYEAIKLKVSDRLVNLLINRNNAIRERVCMILITIADLYDGKKAIVKNKNMLNNIGKLLDDEDIVVRFKILILLDRLAHVWMIADVLVDNGFLHLLIIKLQHNRERDCLELYLKCIESLLYCNGKFIALECELYEILLNILDTEYDSIIIGAALKDISILTQTTMGKELSLKYKLLNKLVNYLHDDRVEIYENAACALVFATIKTEAILKAMEIPKLFDRLLLLSKNHNELCTQKYCLQTLANLAGHAKVKKDFMDDHFDEIKAINVNHDSHGEWVKNILLHSVLYEV